MFNSSLNIIEKQCSTFCGAIEDRSISLKAIDVRVFPFFATKMPFFPFFGHKNAVFSLFRNKNAVITHFGVQNFWFNKYVTRCLTRASTDAFRSCFVKKIGSRLCPHTNIREDVSITYGL